MGLKVSGRKVAGKSFRRGLAATASAVALLAGMVVQPGSVGAQEGGRPASEAEASKAFDIPAQDLNSALLSFARSTGLQVFYETELVKGKTSPALSGTFTAAQGLSRLLTASGLVWRFTGSNTVTLEKVTAAGDGAIAIEAVSVEGRASAPVQAQISAPPPVFAGSTVARGARLGVLGNKDMMDTPFSAMSYTAENIQNQQARTIADVLENDPSVRFTVTRGHMQENFTIRGFEVLSNEIAVNGMYGLAPLGHTPTEFLERVEVLRGPNALLNGAAPSGGVGGAVNLVTKRAGEKPTTAVTVDYTSPGQPGVHLDSGRRFGSDNEFGARVNLVRREGDTSIRGQDKESRLGAVALDYSGENLRLSLDAYSNREVFHNGSPAMVNFLTNITSVPKAPDGDTNLFKGAFGKINNAAAIGRVEYDITRDITAYASFGRLDHHQHGFITSTHARNISNPAGVYTPTTTFRQDYLDSYSMESGLRAKFETGAVGHQMVAGASNLLQEIGLSSATATSTANSGSIYSNIWPTLARDSGPPLKTEDLTLTSIMLADTLSVLDDRVQLTLGARRQQIRDTYYANGKFSGKYDQFALSPAAGLVVKPLNNVSVFANYIEALSKGNRVTNTAASNYGHMFAPFKTWQMEGGIKWEEGKIANTLSLFQIYRRTLSNVGNVYMEGEQRNRGIEWNVFGEVVERVRVQGGMVFTDGKMVKGATADLLDKVPYGLPEWQGNFGVEVDPPFLDGLTLLGRTVYTGKQFANSGNTLTIPEWWRFDVGANYTLPIHETNLTVRAFVTNLMNDNYWVGSFSDGYLTVSEPRTFNLSATVVF